MASTISLTGDWLVSFGNQKQTVGTGNLGTYATNGVTVTAAQVGLGVITALIIQPAGGYTFQFVPSTGKVKAYAATGSGTISVDGSSAKISVVGGQSAGPALQITPDSSSAIVGKTTATTVTATAPITGVTAAFTGTAGALTEVANATDLSGTTFTFQAQGY
jgi:hypothetical protein